MGTLRYVSLHNPFHEATNVGIGCKAVAQEFSDVAAELRARTVLISSSKMYCCGSQWPCTSHRNILRRRFVIIIIIIIIIILIIIGISFMQGIYTYIPETNHFPREHRVAAILVLLFMVLISLVPALTELYLYVSTFRSMCAVPNMAVFCSSLTS